MDEASEHLLTNEKKRPLMSKTSCAFKPRCLSAFHLAALLTLSAQHPPVQPLLHKPTWTPCDKHTHAHKHTQPLHPPTTKCTVCRAFQSFLGISLRSSAPSSLHRMQYHKRIFGSEAVLKEQLLSKMGKASPLQLWQTARKDEEASLAFSEMVGSSCFEYKMKNLTN